MNPMSSFKAWMQRASPVVVLLLSSFSAFSIYVCTYSFRKSFAAATFEGMTFWRIDYKTLLVIAQVFGYAMSKFVGVKFISEVDHGRRPVYIIGLLLFAWLTLLLFALVPAPWGILCLFLNGLPLGLIWGLVYSYLEGRKRTEIMAAILSTSLVFSAGVVKGIGQYMIEDLHMRDTWMPFCVGALFFLPMLLFVFLLHGTPSPSEADKAARTERVPMYGKERTAFIREFWPGLLFNICLYIALTMMRDVRDNFEVDIWKALAGHVDPSVYARIDTPVAVLILLCVGALVSVKDNKRAFQLSHLLIFIGFVSIGVSTFLFDGHYLPVYGLMYGMAFGLYLAYIPYQVIFFERLIAGFRIRGNVGFLIYLADSIGYLGSVGVLLYKQFGTGHISWGTFFIEALSLVAVIGMVCIALSYLYFRRKDAAYSPKIRATLSSA